MTRRTEEVLLWREEASGKTGGNGGEHEEDRLGGLTGVAATRGKGRKELEG